jgi:hypothetical protein
MVGITNLPAHFIKEAQYALEITKVLPKQETAYMPGMNRRICSVFISNISLLTGLYNRFKLIF